MTSRNVLFGAFVLFHLSLSTLGIAYIAEKAIARQDLICQEGCE